MMIDVKSQAQLKCPISLLGTLSVPSGLAQPLPYSVPAVWSVVLISHLIGPHRALTDIIGPHLTVQ